MNRVELVPDRDHKQAMKDRRKQQRRMQKEKQKAGKEAQSKDGNDKNQRPNHQDS